MRGMMKKSLLDRITSLMMTRGKYKWLVHVFFYTIGLSPVVLLAVFSLYSAYTELTYLTVQRQEDEVRILAGHLREDLEKLITQGSDILSANPAIHVLVTQQRWEEAANQLAPLVNDSPYIDRIFLTDTEGNELAAFPLLRGGVGQNYAHREWYHGVSLDWEPYVSSIYERGAEPQKDVIAVAIPIKNSLAQPIGILVFQMLPQVLTDASFSLQATFSGEFYYIDGNNALVNKSTSLNEAATASLESLGLHLEGSGVQVRNPLSNTDAFLSWAPVPGFDWKVMILSHYQDFFLIRTNVLKNLGVVYATIALIALLITYLLIRFVNLLDGYRQVNQVYLEGIGDGVCAIDRFWNITLWNHMAEELSGWKASEVLGRPLREYLKLVRADDQQENIRFIEETMLYGKQHDMENDTLLITRSGAQLPVADSCAPLFDDEGRVRGAILVFRDVTKERELAKLRKEFISLASHELRTPLTAIRGYADLLINGDAGKLSTKQHDMLSTMIMAADKMNELINGMLNISRIDLGTIAVEPKIVDAKHLFEKTLLEFIPQIKQKKINVKKEFDDSIGGILVDPQIMSVVLRNLISNAVKFTPKQGKIVLGMHHVANYIQLTVSDTGIGIPKKDQEKVFSRLFRASNTSAHEGTGLGLYTTKKVLEQAGCEIWFKSVEGEGSTFYVSIPRDGMTRHEGIKGLA